MILEILIGTKKTKLELMKKISLH